MTTDHEMQLSVGTCFDLDLHCSCGWSSPVDDWNLEAVNGLARSHVAPPPVSLADPLHPTKAEWRAMSHADRLAYEQWIEDLA